ncbi:MutS protein msh5 [Coelomomyces lativittatus]|nr:MutS protein msh5 [Coelomomyces lativittatus]
MYSYIYFTKTFSKSFVQFTLFYSSKQSLSIPARKHRFVQPKIVSEPIFEVKNARHPLLEHYTQPYISNDIQSHEDCIQIITGPNASGKSVYLKTIGLITYLAHLGSFVPADEATLGLTDKLFTRMVTKESVARVHLPFSL